MRHGDNELVHSPKNLNGIEPHNIHCWRRITQQFDQTFVKSRIGLISESQGTFNSMELEHRVKGKYFDNQGQEIWQNNAKLPIIVSPIHRKQGSKNSQHPKNISP